MGGIHLMSEMLVWDLQPVTEVFRATHTNFVPSSTNKQHGGILLTEVLGKEERIHQTLKTE